VKGKSKGKSQKAKVSSRAVPASLTGLGKLKHSGPKHF